MGASKNKLKTECVRNVFCFNQHENINTVDSDPGGALAKKSQQSQYRSYR